MAGVNKVILLGNLGKDPEVKQLESGKMRASLSLATSEVYKNKEGEKVTSTEWHTVVLWSPLAEIAAKYLSKGKQVYIEGKITSRSYIDKEGQTKYMTEIVGQSLHLLGGREDGSSSMGEKERERMEDRDPYAFLNTLNPSSSTIDFANGRPEPLGKQDDLPF